jgi:hypothetical protein
MQPSKLTQLKATQVWRMQHKLDFKQLNAIEVGECSYNSAQAQAQAQSIANVAVRR